MEKVILLCIAVALSGCAWDQTKPDVLVPVAAPSKKPPVISRPHLPIHDLTDLSTPDTIAMSYKLTVKQLQQWGLEQEALLDGYRSEDIK